MPHARFTGNDASIDSQALARIPFDDFAAAQYFKPRLIKRLALFERHGNSHLVHPLANQAGGL